MNIEEIKQRALKKGTTLIGSPYEILDEDLFAELIIQECFKLLLPDAERYQFLRKNITRLYVTADPIYEVGKVDKYFVQSIEIADHFKEADLDSVDIAVDIAMKRITPNLRQEGSWYNKPAANDADG